MTSLKETNGVANQHMNGLLEKTNPKSDTAELPAPDPNNPFYFPEFSLPSGLLFNGVRVMKCPVKDDPMTHLKKIYDLPMRDDDIIITAYPKCGEFIDPKSSRTISISLLLSYAEVIQYPRLVLIKSKRQL